VSHQFKNPALSEIGQTASDQSEKIQTVSGQLSATLSHKLSWSHYFEILKSDNKLEISFYTKQCEKEKLTQNPENFLLENNE
jgi:hypothetical protein